MKRFIYRYLNRTYVIKNRVICEADSFTIVNIYTLLDGLKLVFGLTTKQLKPYVRDWSWSLDKGFNFKEFWATLYYKGWFFPLAKQVFARTIAMDLVSVQPMSAPRGILHHFDVHYGDRPVVEYVNQLNEESVARAQMMHDWGQRLFGN